MFGLDVRRFWRRPKEADKAINLLAQFLRAAPNIDTPVDPVSDALGILHMAVAGKRRLADDHLKLYSRNKTREAARAQGAGWIRDSLESICRRHGTKCEPRHAAVIATAALGMGQVTTDAIGKAPSMADRLGRANCAATIRIDSPSIRMSDAEAAGGRA